MENMHRFGSFPINKERGRGNLPDIGEGFVFADEVEAQTACEWWQKHLSLSDFTVACRLKRAADLPPGKQGTSDWVLSRREILVKLLDPIDYPPDCIVPQDHERTLVHELIHPKLGYFDNTPDDESSTRFVMMETFIDDLARALVKFRRLAYPEPPWRCS